MNIFDKAPMVDKNAFVAPSASIIGDVQVVRGSSVWYGCVLRGDVNGITVGSGTNIQDNSLVHVPKSNISGKVLPTIIGDNVTVVSWSKHTSHSVLYMVALLKMKPLLVWEPHFLMGRL